MPGLDRAQAVDGVDLAVPDRGVARAVAALGHDLAGFRPNDDGAERQQRARQAQFDGPPHEEFVTALVAHG